MLQKVSFLLKGTCKPLLVQRVRCSFVISKPIALRCAYRCYSAAPIRDEAHNLTDLGKQYFDSKKFDEAEALLKMAAAGNDSEAQFQLGLLLTTPQQTSKDAGSAQSTASTNAAEVQNEIKKLRKESLMAKQVQSGSVAAFQKALQKRQQGSQLEIKVEHSTAASRKKAAEAESQEAKARKAEGLAWLRQAAEAGHSNAMCYLGNLQLSQAQSLLDDITVPNAHAVKKKATELITEAVRYYERAAAHGNAAAAFNLGVLYHDGITCDMPTAAPVTQQKPAEKNDQKESATVVKAAGSGSLSEVQVTVSKVSNRSKRNETADPVPESKPIKCDIVVADLPLSLKHFERAAELGEPTASLWCGYCYSTGEGGVPSSAVDEMRAFSFLTTATEHDDTKAKAHFYLSQVLGDSSADQAETSETDSPVANARFFVDHLQLAVQGGDEDALNCLADLHLQQYVHLSSTAEEGGEQGGQGEEVHSEEVLSMLAQDLQSKSESADSSCHHQGCTHDHHHDHNHDHSDNHQHNHSHEHLHDHQGVHVTVRSSAEQHLHRAVALFERASAAGQATATLTLGALTYQGIINGSAGVVDKRRSFELYNLAAEQGSLDAWRNLASMYYLGDGVPRSEVTAREIMRVMFGK